MTYVAPNSVQARDIASLVHPQTNLAQHLEEGPVVISRGQGIYVWDRDSSSWMEPQACGARR
jgi:4-aminobutyrate--pyruvate transaminase